MTSGALPRPSGGSFSLTSPARRAASTASSRQRRPADVADSRRTASTRSLPERGLRTFHVDTCRNPHLSSVGLVPKDAAEGSGGYQRTGGRGAGGGAGGAAAELAVDDRKSSVFLLFPFGAHGLGGDWAQGSGLCSQETQGDVPRPVPASSGCWLGCSGLELAAGRGFSASAPCASRGLSPHKGIIGSNISLQLSQLNQDVDPNSCRRF